MAEEEVLDQEVPNESEMDSGDKILGMSDDDLLNMSPEEFAAKAGSEPKEPEQQREETPAEEETPEEEETSEEPEEEEFEERSESAEREDIYEQEPSETEEIEAAQDGSTEDQIDYKIEYEKLLLPFKASGREVKVNSVEDARTLMQKGVDYNNKMAAMKPHLKILKALENNNLLDPDKIDLFIDLDKKNPDAIARFLKDSEIDPMDLNLEETAAYQPKSYMPSDQEITLDQVLDSIRGTDTFQRTVDELGNKWDAASKQIFMDTPHLIKVINDHMAMGVYDQIMNAVQTERLLGRLQGVHDLAAYKQIGDAMQAAGGFDHLKSEPASKPQHRHVQDPKRQQDRRNEKRRAAAPIRGTVKKPEPDFNPLSMSDDEFEKVSIPGMAH